MADKEVPSKTSDSGPDTPEPETPSTAEDGRELSEREQKFVAAFESEVEDKSDASDEPDEPKATAAPDEPEKPGEPDEPEKPAKAAKPDKPEKPEPDVTEASAEVQRHIKELEDRLKAHQGQLAPTQRVAQERLDENKRLKTELEELRKESAAQVQKLEKWEKHKGDFPDDSAAFEELVEARVADATTSLKQQVESLKARLDSQTQEIDGRISGVEHNTARQNLEAELAAISEAHSDYETIVKHDPKFYAWVGEQPDDVQRMFQRNLKQNVTAKEMNWLLSSYKRDQRPESDDPTPPPKPNGNNGVQAQRQARVQRATQPAGGDTPSVSTPQHRRPMTREEEFALAWEAQNPTG